MNFNTAKKMMNRKGFLCAAAAALILTSITPSFAGDTTRFQAQPRGSKVQIQGDSTFHSWTMDGIVIGGFMEVDSAVKFDQSQADLAGAKDGKVSVQAQAMIPVRSVKSDAKIRADIMDGLYQDALSEKQFPRIQYVLKEMKLKPGHAAGKPFEFDTKGELSIAGKTNSVEFPVTVEQTAMDMIKVKGTAPVKMSAFGVKPPAPTVLGIGTMKCGDDVKIVFEWSLAQKKP
jgi:polyisoprenoid-binding protein YceI